MLQLFNPPVGADPTPLGVFQALHYQATVARVGEWPQSFRGWSAAVEAVLVREEEPRGLQMNMFGDLGVSSVQNW